MRHQRGHLLLRIFFTYLLTALLILGAVAFLFFSFRPEKKLPLVLEKNLGTYLTMLQERIKAEPTPEGIAKVKSELGLNVRTEPLAKIADEQGLPSFEEIDSQESELNQNLQFGRYKGFFFVTNRQLLPKTIWFIPIDSLPERFRFTFVGIAIVLISILIMSFLTIRWMMSPIKTLLQGVDHLTNGNLKFRIESGCRNEFEVISAAFNRMASRLENMISAKERLLRDVSHELRSPLTRINVATDLLENEKMKEQIKSDVKKMDQLIKEVLETYRIHDESFRIQLNEINIKEFFAHIISDYQDGPCKTELLNPIPDDLNWKIDPFHFERVIRNLIENAIKYSGSNKVLLQVTQKNTHLEISVIDKGKGISESDQSHIFEPFYRVDQARNPNREGYGLGLAICKAIIDAHSGSINVVSQTGVGTTVTILL
jgi:signal transduction histidine kinase